MVFGRYVGWTIVEAIFARPAAHAHKEEKRGGGNNASAQQQRVKAARSRQAEISVQKFKCRNLSAEF